MTGTTHTVSNFYTEKLLETKAVLAPMAGFTDAPFRKLCRDYGSAWAVTEMVSAKALVQGQLQGIEIGEPYPYEPDLVIQVFGGEPEIVAAGGRILYDTYAPKALDVNMGCPVKKVTGKSCGSKLMLEPARAADIIRALKGAVPVPVSAKMRLGYDAQNVVEVAQALEDAGADLIAVHGRTAKQKYGGEADWHAIKNVADKLSIPVVGSGDVKTVEQFRRYRAWGLGVMVARAAVGRPWLFAELGGVTPPGPTEKLRVAFHHAVMHCAWYDKPERYAMQSFRGQLIKYFEDFDARKDVVRVSSLRDLQDLVYRYTDIRPEPNANALRFTRPNVKDAVTAQGVVCG